MLKNAFQKIHHIMFKQMGGGIKGYLNNVKKNCTFLAGWLPLCIVNGWWILYFNIANGLRSIWAIDHKWLSTYILQMCAFNGQQVLVMGNNTYILPMGEAKEPLAAPVHCLHRSVWAATKSQFVEHLSGLQSGCCHNTWLLVPVMFLLYSSWIFLAASVK